MLQPLTCNVFVVSLIKLSADIFRLSPGVPFGRAVRAAFLHRIRPPLGAVVLSADWLPPNGSDGSALGACLFYDIFG